MSFETTLTLEKKGFWEFNKDGTALLFLLLIFNILFFPVLFEEKTFFFRDIPHFAFPMKNFVWRTFSEGFMPYWFPNIFGGVPFLALLHTSVFYPLNIFFFLPDFILAFNLYILSHHLVLMISVYFLVRFWGISVYGALCSAITALLGGYFLSLSSIYNHFQSAVWLPLIFLFFHKYLEKGSAKDFAAAVIFLTFQVLGGSPENCILTVLMLYAYSLILAPRQARITGNGKKTLVLGGVVLLALGISAPQLFPTYMLLDHMLRGDGLAFEASTNWSLKPDFLSTLFLPQDHTGFMHKFGGETKYFLQCLYMGIVPLVFVFAGIFKFFRRKPILFWIGGFIAGIFFALGKYNPLYHFFFDWIPLMDKFRHPEKFFFVSAFSLVFLVGYGLDAIAETIGKTELRGKFLLLLFGGTGVAITAASFFPSAGDLGHAFLVLLIFAASCFFLFFGFLNINRFKILILLLLVFDLFFRNYSLVPMIDRQFFLTPPNILKSAGDKETFFRTYSGSLSEDIFADRTRFPEGWSIYSTHIQMKERLYPNLGTVYGIDYADGLTGIEIKDAWLWSSVFSRSPKEKRLRILQRSNARYWVTDEDEISPAPEQPWGQKKVEVLEDALPRAFLVPTARLGEEIKLINTYFDESFDPLSEVLLDEPVNLTEVENFSAEVEEIKYHPNHVTVKTRLNGDGFLVLLDSFFPGWTVKVDGRTGKILRANHFYRAVQLTKGSHTVHFKFEPEGLREGWFVSLCTMLIFIICIGVLTRRKTSPGSTSASP